LVFKVRYVSACPKAGNAARAAKEPAFNSENGFGLGEGGDFHHKYSYEARMFKSTKNGHTKH
jgi:hypothetical protein